MGPGKSLLASDMDGTVIPLEVGPHREAELAEFRDAVMAAPELILAYVTGRGLGLAEKGIREFRLPPPDFLVCDVGTSLYRNGPHGFDPDPHYQERMREAMGGLDFRDVREHLRPIHDLLLQPQERQTEFKLSFHLPRDGDHAGTIGRVRERVEELEGRIQAVFSVGAPSGTPLLDLLPAGAGKDSALRYLQEVTGVDEDRIVYAGDSGNDLAALLAGFKGIVVSNAGEDLRSGLDARLGNGGSSSEIHFANHPFAKGVLEGCRHFGIL